MKKTESKLKTSKSSPVVKGSAASSKTAKPCPVSYTHLDVYKRQPLLTIKSRI